VDGTRFVAYAKSNESDCAHYRLVSSGGSIECTNGVFGNPHPGFQKECCYFPVIAVSAYANWENCGTDCYVAGYHCNARAWVGSSDGRRPEYGYAHPYFTLSATLYDSEMVGSTSQNRAGLMFHAQRISTTTCYNGEDDKSYYYSVLLEGFGSGSRVTFRRMSANSGPYGDFGQDTAWYSFANGSALAFTDKVAYTLTIVGKAECYSAYINGKLVFEDHCDDVLSAFAGTIGYIDHYRQTQFSALSYSGSYDGYDPAAGFNRPNATTLAQCPTVSPSPAPTNEPTKIPTQEPTIEFQVSQKSAEQFVISFGSLFIGMGAMVILMLCVISVCLCCKLRRKDQPQTMPAHQLAAASSSSMPREMMGSNSVRLVHVGHAQPGER